MRIAHLLRSLPIAALLLLAALPLAAQNIGINANGATPNTSAILDIDVSGIAGTKRGLLIPRVTTVERNAIATPATSLLIFNTTTARFEYFDGLAWVPFVGGGTLDQAYDFGGTGLGRTITADAGAVTVAGTDGFVSTGTLGSGAVAPAGAGTRMVWNPNKAAFRVGQVNSTQWDNANIGTNSVAMGFATRASGFSTTALGENTVASGNYSTALGTATIANGEGSIAMGYATITNGMLSTAAGAYNTASSYGESVLGIGATTYTPSVLGATQYRVANATDRLLVVGNAIDANNNDVVDLAERSNALVILKNGNTGIGSPTPADRLHVVGNIRMVDGNQALGRVLVSNANGTGTWTDPLAVATGLAWTLTGNAGTNPATNFLGTTDAQPLRFRTGNAFAGQLSNTATGVVSFGLGAGAVNTGTNNTFLGSGAGAANVASGKNTYVGTSAGAANVNGQQNVYIGRLAGGNGVSGSDNILIGNGAGLNTTANNNVMIGSFAGNATSTGGGNIFMGTQAGVVTSTGGQNTFIGTDAGLTNTTGAQNTLIGNGAAVNANNLTNATAIGRASRVDVSNGLVLGSVNGINAATSTSLVGIGTTAPLDRLHVEGNIRMVDGNQAAGRVLMSDANGTATWTAPGAGTSGTLDQSYDFGGAGVGRTIVADAGAVTIAGTDGLVSTGTQGSGVLAPSGGGPRMVWNPRKSAFRAGIAFTTSWDDANIGLRSVAFGSGTVASGAFSSATGNQTTASGESSSTMGALNLASGDHSTAMGLQTIASGDNSYAMGRITTASGNNSTAMGLQTTAPSYVETVLGIGNTTYIPSSLGFFAPTDRLLVVGNAQDLNVNGFVEPIERSDAFVILKNGNSGFGVSAPVTRLELREPPNATKTQLTQGLLSSGLLITTDFTLDAFTPGLFWNTTNNNATRPKAGIFLQETNTGTFMYLGTSNNYSTGITNDAVVIDPEGHVAIGFNAPLTSLHVVGGVTLNPFVPALVTVDNQLVPVGNQSNLWIQSNSAAAVNRTITLGDGAAIGQLLILTNPSNTFSYEVADDAINRNTNTAVGRNMGFNDFLTLMWTGTFWSEVSYADN